MFLANNFKEVFFLLNYYDEKANELTLKGFFSEYLPPCFKLSPEVLLLSPKNNCDLIVPYSFTMSRHIGNGSRRTIFIPEICAYLATYSYMKSNNIFQELIEFSETSTHSFSPILKPDGSILSHEQAYDIAPLTTENTLSEYINNISKKIIQSAGSKKILKLDISNCYSSLYIHMLPAIILGADKAEIEYDKYKCNKNDPTIDPQYIKYAKLDQIIRKQNLNRTNGTLTGTLFSKMIIESLLSRIDRELETYKLNFARYVDDYEVFLTDENEKTVISNFSSTLKKYGFALNSEKIETIDFPYYLVENFEKILSGYPNTLNDANIIDIFTTFSNFEKEGVKGALRFLLKTFEKTSPEIENPDLYKSYLFTVMANNERSLIKACSILLNEYTKEITEKDVTTIKSLLKTHICFEHDLEVIWLLYLLTKIDNVSKQVITDILQTNNELAQLILLHNNLLNDEEKNIIITKAKSWILLYELYSRDLIDEALFISKLKLKNNIGLYKTLKEKNIHFIK